MAITIETDVPHFREGIQKLAKAQNRAVRDVMLEQTGILAGQLVKRFPPKTKKMGKTAIENDLNRIMIGMPDDKRDTLERWQDTLETQHDVFDDSGVRIQDWHEKHRSSRTGRTRSIKGKTHVGGRHFSNKLHVRQSHLKRYRTRRGKTVGSLKAGWLPGTRWGGKRPAQWIQKAGGSGQAVNRMRPNGSGYLLIVNNAPYASRWRRINNFVVRSRTRGMEKSLKFAIAKAVKENNRRAA